MTDSTPEGVIQAFLTLDDAAKAKALRAINAYMVEGVAQTGAVQSLGDDALPPDESQSDEDVVGDTERWLSDTVNADPYKRLLAIEEVLSQTDDPVAVGLLRTARSQIYDNHPGVGMRVGVIKFGRERPYALLGAAVVVILMFAYWVKGFF